MTIEAMCARAREGMLEVADPSRVAPMQAYLKTDMPMHGVSQGDVKKIARVLKKAHPPTGREDWEARVGALWAQPFREEKHLALAYARAFPKLHRAASLELFERLVREGAWWDLVDTIASHLVGGAWMADRDEVAAAMDRWIEDPDLWVRRSAILGQLRHKQATDVPRLLRYCRAQAHDTSFWIRKAIGWALRQHSKTDPEAVRRFVDEMGDALSGLSRREARKYL